MNEGAFFRDLAIMMAVAGLAAALFTRYKWPKVIGFILVGVLLNGYTWGGSFLVEPESINSLGQLGAVFLMFALGLSFSTRSMSRLKHVVVPVAIFDTVVMTWFGYTVGTRLLGWDAIPSLFLGAAICDSATTMLAKVIDEMKWGAKPFFKYTIGTSICEDLITVGVIAIVTGVAGGKGLSLGAAGTSLGALFVFLLAVIVFGFVLIPRLLLSVSKRKDDETLLLTILGCLFLVSYIAYRFQFSLAIGAFLVGIIGAASDVRNKLLNLASPLKNMFAAMFFVSVGLLFDPHVCISHFGTIILLSAVVVVGKFLNCTLMAILAGERVKTAVQMGMSLAQIGEFAFLVALLYLSTTHDDTSPMYQVVIAVSLLTTLLSPYLIRASEPVGEWVETHVPARLAHVLETYRAVLEKYRSSTATSAEHRSIRSAVIRLVLVAVLEFAFATVCVNLSRFNYSRFAPFFEQHDLIIFFILSDLGALGLFPFVIRYARQIATGISSVLARNAPRRARKAITGMVRTVAVIAAGIAFFGEVAALNVTMAPPDFWVRWGVFLILVAIAIFGWRFFLKAAHRATRRFNEALSAEDRVQALNQTKTLTVPVATYRELPIGHRSPAIGQNVVTLNVRAISGATIVAVDRAGRRLRIVGPTPVFEAGDTIIAIADDEQYASLKEIFGC